MIRVKTKLKAAKEMLFTDLSEDLTGKSERAEGRSFQKQAEVTDQFSWQMLHGQGYFFQWFAPSTVAILLREVIVI